MLGSWQPVLMTRAVTERRPLSWQRRRAISVGGKSRIVSSFLPCRVPKPATFENAIKYQKKALDFPEYHKKHGDDAKELIKEFEEGKAYHRK
jgi:hypothetical protein